MKGLTSPYATLAEALAAFLAPNAWVPTLAATLSANAQYRNEVVYAADHNMRVLVTIKDKPVHTSYSTVVTYQAVY